MGSFKLASNKENIKDTNYGNKEILIQTGVRSLKIENTYKLDQDIDSEKTLACMIAILIMLRNNKVKYVQRNTYIMARESVAPWGQQYVAICVACRKVIGTRFGGHAKEANIIAQRNGQVVVVRGYVLPPAVAIPCMVEAQLLPAVEKQVLLVVEEQMLSVVE